MMNCFFIQYILWKGGIYGSKRKNNRMVIQDGMVVFVFVTLAHRIFFLATNSADLLLASLKVSYFQNDFMKSSFLPKYEQKIVRISALCSEGRNLDNFFVRILGETMTS